MTTYQGSCHCGAIRFEVEADFAQFTQCDCSLCRKKNAVMAQVHESKFRLLAGEDQLGLYQWNHRIAKHYFCKTCGIYPFHKKRSAPDCYGINVYCLDDADLDAVPVVRVDGKGMSLAD